MNHVSEVSSNHTKQLKIMAWLMLCSMLLSLAVPFSMILLIVFLGAGAAFALMATKTIIQLQKVASTRSVRTLLTISIITFIGFVYRWFTLWATSQPARYADYTSDSNPVIQFFASNTNFFYITSVALLIGSSLAFFFATRLKLANK